jgi:hypothetical protein
LLGLAAFTSKCPIFPQLKHGKLLAGKLLWGPDGSLLRWWNRSPVELLLLLLLVLWIVAPIMLLLRSAQLTHRQGIHHRYLGGAPIEPPLAEDPGIILFFSSASAMAFIITS